MKSLRLIVIALVALFGFSQVSLSADLTGIWEVHIKVAGGDERTDTVLIVQEGDSFTYGPLSGAIRNGKYTIYGPLPRTLVKSYWLQGDKIVLNPEDDDHFTGMTYISIYPTEKSTSKMMSTDARMEGVRVMDPPPIISLEGKPEIWVKTGSQFEDAGAKANNETGADISDKLVINNPVDTGTPGDYTITYNITGENGKPAKEVSRLVHVVDPAPPTIDLRGDAVVNIKKGSGYLDSGPKALNFLNENISDKIVSTVNGKEMDPRKIDTSKADEVYKVVYTVSDENGTATAKRTINIEGLEDEQSFFKYCFISNLMP